MGRRWSAAEIETLRAKLADGLGDAEIARELGRTAAAVTQQRLRLDVKINPARAAHWTLEEDAELLRRLDEGDRMGVIAKSLGRSYTACSLRRMRLNADSHTARKAKAAACQGLPSWHELSDAIARWGVAEAAEEYEVTPEKILEWRKTLTNQEDM